MARFEPVRLWLYGLIAPVVALLVLQGVVSDEAAPLWIALATAVLTVTGAEAARSKVTSKAWLREEASPQVPPSPPVQ